MNVKELLFKLSTCDDSKKVTIVAHGQDFTIYNVREMLGAVVIRVSEDHQDTEGDK